MRENDAGELSIVLSGEIDLSNAAEFLDLTVRETNGFRPDVILDLSQVEFMDSHGIRALIQMQKSAVRTGSILRMSLGENDLLKRVFEIAGLERIFSVVHGG